jgi:hypothetical protein
MEQQKIMTHITKGLIIGLLAIIIGIAGYLGGIDQQSWFKWISTIIICIGVIWACIYYAQQLDGRVTFGNVFAHGFKTSVVVALLVVVYFVLAVTVIFPEMKDKAMEAGRQQMESAGKYSEEQINQGLEIAKKFFTIFGVAGILLGTLIAGAIAALIGAAVAKKKPVNPLDQLPS